MTRTIRRLFIGSVALAAIAIGSPAQARGQAGVRGSEAKVAGHSTYVQDYQAISIVLNKYIDGCIQAKSSIMKPAFSPRATMYSVGPDGMLEGGTIQGLFDGIDKGFRPSPDAKAAITRIEIVGTAANARIDANNVSGLSFTDFFQLLKVKGEWIVISKIFYTHSAS